MARIPYFDSAEAEKSEREFFEKLPPLNIFRMLGHAGITGRYFVKLGGAILAGGRLDPVLRELAIIRTGILCGSRYEVHQHRRIGRDLGISEEKMRAIEIGSSSPVFSGIERTVLKFTEEVVANVKAGDAIFQELAGSLSHRELTELIIAIGYYMMVSHFLENLEVDIESE